ncbi:hypothetical protein [Streptomyces sp. NPDC093261]|uniref:hypothetical protein n=1 Tax=Streptomyces sp. NPDC093261 TaxID=3366037 RepID=UPI00380F118A
MSGAGGLHDVGDDPVAAALPKNDGEPRFLPVVSERARAKLNRIAATMTRPPKQKAWPLAKLREEWKESAIRTSGVAADIINSLLEYARAEAAAIRARVAAVVDIALAAVDVAATVFAMNGGGWFHRRHLLAEARRHLALVLRGRRREPGLDEHIVDAALATYCVDISEPKTLRGLMPDYRLYTARWSLADLQPARRPPTTAPNRQPPTDPGTPAAPRPSDLEPGERQIPRVPLPYERAVLAGAVLREKLRTTVAARGRAYDVVAHQQAAMPEQLLALPAADPEHDDQEPELGRREAIDMTALRALRESRTGVEALDLTAERLRHLQDAFTKGGRRLPRPRGPLRRTGPCRPSAPGAPGRSAGAPTAGARTAPRPGGRPLTGAAGVHRRCPASTPPSGVHRPGVRDVAGTMLCIHPTQPRPVSGRNATPPTALPHPVRTLPCRRPHRCAPLRGAPDGLGLLGVPLWRAFADTGADLLWRVPANRVLPVTKQFRDARGSLARRSRLRT